MTDPYANPSMPYNSGEFPMPQTFPPAAQPYPSGELFPVSEQPLVTIADIAVTRTSVIVPTGQFPLRGTTWTLQDSTQVSETIPVYAIILTILFVAACLLGLLFLLIKEKRVTGFVTVTVVGPGMFHSAQLPAGEHVVRWATNQVNQARALAAVA